MQHTIKNYAAIALVAASLLGTTPASAAEDSMPMRAASMLGDYIAHQGNAALIQIQQDLKKDLARKLRPLMPTQNHAAVQAPGQPQQPSQPAAR